MLLDGEPMTREAMVNALVEARVEGAEGLAAARGMVRELLSQDRSPEFDVARGLYKEFALGILDWCRKHRLDVELGRAR